MQPLGIVGGVNMKRFLGTHGGRSLAWGVFSELETDVGLGFREQGSGFGGLKRLRVLARRDHKLDGISTFGCFANRV